MIHKYVLQRKWMLVLVLLGATMGVQAQQEITGTVTDGSNPLPGVSVLVKGSTQGTQTDPNGAYSIQAQQGAVLQFSFLGFETQEIVVEDQGTINVVLEEDAEQLAEVVVTGFGVEREVKKLSYAVQQVDGSDLARTNTPNLVNALQGKVAGVSISQGASGPTSASRIRIRGNASLNSNTQPLFVVDGVIFQPGTSGSSSWGNSDDWGNEINNLNPEDYESVTVLKGSAAAALYGSQAINGVVIIKTKQGNAGRSGLGVTISQNTSFEIPYKIADFQNRFGAGQIPDFLTADDGTPMINNTEDSWYYSFGPEFNGQMVRDVDGRMIPYTSNNDVLDIFRTGHFLNSNVAVDGGNENTTFRFSYTNTINESFVPNNKLTRNNFMIRANQKISNFLNLDASVNYVTVEGKNPLEQGNANNPIFGLSYAVPRSLDVDYWHNNYISEEGGRLREEADPYDVTSKFWNLYKNNGYRDQNEIRANIDLTAQINPWLSLLLRGNIRKNVYKQSQENLGDEVGFQGGSYSISQWSDNNTRLQALLTASKNLNNDLALYLAVGGETQRFNQGERNNSNTVGGLRVPGQFNIANSQEAPATTVDPGRDSRLDAVYAYGDLTWRNMLTLNFSARNDWDSRLTYPYATEIDNNFTYFYPSVGLAWTFSELLLDNPSYSWLNNGKLRASLGYTGGAPDIYATSEGNYSLADFYTTPDGTRIPRYSFSGNTLGNFALKPLISREIEFGLNLNMFQNRAALDVTFYKKNTKNQTLNLGTPSESGVSTQQINAGNIQNSGIEVLLNLTPVRTADFSWNTSFNFSRNWNKIIELAPFVDSYELDLAFGNDVRSIAREGEEYGVIVTKYGYSSYQALDAGGNPVDHPNNGAKILQADGLYLRSVQNGEQEKVLGSALENFLLSNLHTIQYKGLALNLQIDSKFGGMIASATHQYGSQFGSFEGTLFGRTQELGGLARIDENGKTYHDGIIPEGVFQNGTTKTDANGNAVDVSGMTYEEAYEKGLVAPLSAATYYNGLFSWGSGIREESVFENSWVAVREVSLSYSLPNSLASKLKLNNLRVSLIGRNLGYLYTTTKDGINPESIFSNRAGAFAEYGGQPYVRSLGFSIDANF